LNFEHPEDLKAKLNLEISKDPRNLNKIKEDCETALRFAVKTGKFNN
jgi:hypothetical protein